MPRYKKFYCESSSSSDDCCWWPFPFLFANNNNNNNGTNPGDNRNQNFGSFNQNQFPGITVDLGGNPVSIPLFLLPNSCVESILELALMGNLTQGNLNTNNLLFLLPFIYGGNCNGKKYKNFLKNCCSPWWGRNNWWWWNCGSSSSSSSCDDSSSSSSNCGCLYIDNSSSSSSSSCWDYKKSPLYCKMKKKHGQKKLKCRKIGKQYYHNGYNGRNGNNGHNGHNSNDKKELVL